MFIRILCRNIVKIQPIKRTHVKPELERLRHDKHKTTFTKIADISGVRQKKALVCKIMQRISIEDHHYYFLYVYFLARLIPVAVTNGDISVLQKQNAKERRLLSRRLQKRH